MASIVITRPPVDVDASSLTQLEPDALVLTAEERRWGRRRVRTRAGRELHLALPTGSRLDPGDILHVESDWYVRVEAAPERLLAVRVSSLGESARIAFEVGNRHFTLAVDGDRLLVPDDPVMVQLFERLRIGYERTSASFEPVGIGHRHDG